MLPLLATSSVSFAGIIPYCLELRHGHFFFAAIFKQATKQDRHLLSEETCAVYNL